MEDGELSVAILDEGPLVVGDGLRELSVQVIGIGEVVEGALLVAALAKCLQGLVVLLHPGQGHPQIVLDRQIHGLQRRRLAKGVRCRGVIAGQHAGDAEVVERLVVPGLDGEGLAIVLLRPFVHLQAVVDDAQRRERHHRVRIELDRTSERRTGLWEVSLAELGQTEPGVSRGRFGVLLGEFQEESLGAIRILLQVEARDPLQRCRIVTVEIVGLEVVPHRSPRFAGRTITVSLSELFGHRGRSASLRGLRGGGALALGLEHLAIGIGAGL